MTATARRVIALVVAQRVAEMLWSRRNENRLKLRGGVESGRRHYPAMVTMHAAWIAATALESTTTRQTNRAALAGYVALQPLRYWVIRSLGDRWTTRIFVVPGEPAVEHGPFRRVRHPNYLIVAAEIVLLPLALGARRTGFVFTVLNAVLMMVRIPAEENALERAADSSPTEPQSPSMP